VARADGSVGWCVATAATLGWHGARQQPDELARRVFGDPDAVWANGPGKGTAEVVSGGFRVTGRWSFGSGSRHATWFLLPGCAIFERGEPRLGPDGKADTRVMWLPAKTVEVIGTWDATGLRGTSTNDWAVTSVIVPDYGNPSPRDPRSNGPLYRVPHRAIQSLALASVGLGIARGALDAFAELAAAKQPFATKSILNESEWVQVQMGQAEARLRSGRAFMLEAAQALWDEVAEGAAASMKQRVLVRLAATHAIASATEAVDAVFHAGGATSIRAECPLERRFRDAHAVRQHLQGRPDHYRAGGQWALGTEPDSGWL
jgi:alkylation response protein AidB-like acyl-CoA dehydrogenase